MSDSQKAIILYPSWKNYFWHYFFGVLLAPLLVGIIIIWHTERKRRNIHYQISDTSIARIEENTSKELELINILETSLSQPSLQKALNVGDIKLQANVIKLILPLHIRKNN